MFRVLIFKATDNGVDPLAEAGKVKATSTRAALEKGLLSQMIITSGDSYQEAVGKLSKPDQNEVYQKVMEGAPKEKVYRVESLGLYLNGAGKDGLNQSVLEQLLNDKAWFWKDSDAISQSIASSPPSQRRDFVIEKIVGIIGQGDREAALTWIALMQDKNKAASLRKQIIK